jgi:UDP-N-acetylmuramoyl-L-alanyl-D-glutamate--2,6-diaminopimelate ligase
MGALAEKYCDQIFFTDEDPYDENPETIISEVAAGVKNKNKYQVIMNRREAIAAALKAARPNDVVLITGKGTDPYIMRAHGTKEPWSDYKVAGEELAKINA